MFGSTAKIVQENARVSSRKLENLLFKHYGRLLSVLEKSFDAKRLCQPVLKKYEDAFIAEIMGLDACIEEVFSRFCINVLRISVKQNYTIVLQTTPEVAMHFSKELLEAAKALHIIRNIMAHSVNSEKRFQGLVMNNEFATLEKLIVDCGYLAEKMLIALDAVKVQAKQELFATHAGLEVVKNLGIKF